MTTISRTSIATAVLATGVLLFPPITNKSLGQISISLPGVTRSYPNGYTSQYRMRTGYGYNQRTFSGYSNNPYRFPRAMSYSYPSNSRYGYSNGRSYSTYYGGSNRQIRSFRPIYVPQTNNFYAPYGYRKGGF